MKISNLIFALLGAFFLISISACTDIASNNEAANGGAATKDSSAAREENASGENSAEAVTPPEATPEANAANSGVGPNGKKLSPEKLVEELYNQHDNENSPFFQAQDRAKVERYFAANLAALIWKDSNESKNEVGALDFDPLYNAQDTEIAEFNIGAPEISGEKASVVVTFTNFGERQTLKYSLVSENGAWKIADIDYGENSTLVKVFRENKP